MRKTLGLFFICLILGTYSFAQTEAEVRRRLVGTWKLVSTEETLKDGSVRPYPKYGAEGRGFLMYQADGYMCADLVNPNRPSGLIQFI